MDDDDDTPKVHRRLSRRGRDMLAAALTDDMERLSLDSRRRASTDDDRKENEDAEGDASYALRVALRVEASLSESHAGRETDGSHAHELATFWNRSDLKKVDLLWGKEERGDEIHSAAWFEKKFFSKKKNRGSRKIEAQMKLCKSPDALSKYLSSTSARCPWYGARDVWSWKLWPEKKLNGADVVQGDLGDCYLATAISLVAEHYPTALKQRIRKMEDERRYVVYFWSQRHGSCISPSKTMRRGPIEVYVDPTLFVHRRRNRKGAAGLPLYMRSRSGCCYPGIIEKAWLHHRTGSGGAKKRGKKKKKKKKKKKSSVIPPPSYEEIANENSFDAGDLIHVLTGLQIITMSMRPNEKHMSPAQQNDRELKFWNILVAALVEGRAVSGGTSECGSGHSKMSMREWKDAPKELLSHHNYCVLDAGTDRTFGRFLVLRNPQGAQTSCFMLRSTVPWPPKVKGGGSGDGDDADAVLGKDGVFRLRFSDFLKFFTTVSYVEDACPRYPICRCLRYRASVARPEDVTWCDAEGKDEENEGATSKSVETPKKVQRELTYKDKGR